MNGSLNKHFFALFFFFFSAMSQQRMPKAIASVVEECYDTLALIEKTVKSDPDLSKEIAEFVKNFSCAIAHIEAERDERGLIYDFETAQQIVDIKGILARLEIFE